MPAINKCIALLLVCALLMASLCACSNNGDKKTGNPTPSVTSPDDSQGNNPVPSITNPDPTPGQPPDSIWNPLPIDYENTASEAATLVLSDMWAIDFLINLEFDEKPIYDKDDADADADADADPNPDPDPDPDPDHNPNPNPGPDLPERPVNIPEYTVMNDLLLQLERIYISYEAYFPFFQYPVFGDPQIFDNNGMTYVNPGYPGNFRSRIDISSIKVTKLTAYSASFSFNIIDHEFFRDGSMSMTLMPEGWRLDESFFFNCLKRLNVLDIKSEVSWEDNPILDPVQNAGSAKKLTGECMFYNIFINDADSTWDATSIDSYYDMQNEAFRYLEGQAALFGRELYFSATNAENALYFSLDTTIPEDQSNTSWFDSYLMSTEYGDASGLLDALKLFADGIYFDNYGLIININKPGRSYAIAHNTVENVNGDFLAERIVLYYSTVTRHENILSSSKIAHQILRVFGALDLYYPVYGDDLEKELIMQYFPFEIMYNLPYIIPEAAVSAFTAFRIGWRDTLPDQLMMFQVKE